MGFLESLFGDKKQKEINMLKVTVEGIRAQFLKSALESKNDINQIINVLADLDQEIKGIQAYLRAIRESEDESEVDMNTIKKLETFGLRNEEAINILKNRLDDIEKTAGVLKIMGRLSVKNYDAIKSMDSKAKKLDALEKNILEHIKSTPEAVVSKDDYFEELRSLKKRLDMLENNARSPTHPMEENILIRSEKKKQKKQ
ncbi:MAG: hypothetical protein ABIF85_07710 [Nanoarchaeota archaeon]|nr:hypothetical protein [Nanoarchaeota archaeon]MBU4300361.1 hypothetical protein [Nanoarchaeota archaeon]MBU4452150.1 hypothetical protein [Nanoarchaeota archaeon]MCG2724283.1 hypothetical protein [archaeon]